MVAECQLPRSAWRCMVRFGNCAPWRVSGTLCRAEGRPASQSAAKPADHAQPGASL